MGRPPMTREQLKEVPEQFVGEVVQSFVDEGLVRVTCTKSADGTWTVTASSPD